MPKRTIRYFDYAATTPLDPAVLRAMKPYLTTQYGNPSNLYELGRTAKRAIREATDKIAAVLGCRPDEFVYTGSATESDNMAIQGVAKAHHEPGRRIIISALEHKGVMAVADHLRQEGFDVLELPVDEKSGLVSPAALAAALTPETILVSITAVDSETGTIQPIPELAAVIKKFREQSAQREGHSGSLPYFHTDASQAAPYRDVSVDTLGVDLMTLSAHKMYGPKGVGGLYVRRGTRIKPLIFGGGQQGKLRSGTENVPGIVGFGEAFRLCAEHRVAETARIKKLRDTLERGIFDRIPKVVLNGNKEQRLPNFCNVSILDIEGEAMLLFLDEAGIMVNTGSACNSESLEPSYVLTALGNPYEFVHGSIRFTLGRNSTMEDVTFILDRLPAIVTRLRGISPLNLSPDKRVHMSQPEAFVGGQTPHFLRKKQK
jgi:cysteine desulfurase